MRDEEFDGIDDYNNQQWNNIDEPYYYLSEQELDELTATVRQEERELIIKLLEQHKQTSKSVSGFLGVCTCGLPIDDYIDHLQRLIKGESNG